MLRTRALLHHSGLDSGGSDEAVWWLPFKEVLVQAAGTGTVEEDRGLEGTWLLLSLIMYLRSSFLSQLLHLGEKGGQAVF